MKNRMFSLPYNGTDIETYLTKLLPYTDHIENIYLGLPFVHSHLGEEALRANSHYDEMCRSFLTVTRDIGVERIVTVNSSYEGLTASELDSLINKINTAIDDYSIDGIICSYFMLAQELRRNFPKLKINTSCNCFHTNIRQMEYWDREIGIDCFNTPRSSARDIRMLKKMKEHGFSLKTLVNESCLFGCPEEVSHYVELGSTGRFLHLCMRQEPEQFFKRCFVVPRWLDLLDEYVDVYKISGRHYSNVDYIFRLLDLYLNGSECNISEIYNMFGDNRPVKEIYTTDFPDKLMYCRCENCGTCTTCRELAEKFFGKA